MKDLYKIFNKELLTREYDTYRSEMFSEEDLYTLASIIKENTSNLEEFTFNLLSDLSNEYPLTKEFDWNVGSTLQHFESEIVISAFKKIKSQIVTI